MCVCFSFTFPFIGGEGSILGSAGSVIGIGSDIGGSIRMPCFFNGIFGHKATPGVFLQMPDSSSDSVHVCVCEEF